MKASTAPVSAASCSARIAFFYLVGEAMLIAAAVAGSMLAIAIEVTDPRFHDVAIPLAGVVVGLWVVAAISLTLRALRRSWFRFLRAFFGSWLVAIGLLYGGTSLIPK